jgi:hypothetical protein
MALPPRPIPASVAAFLRPNGTAAKYLTALLAKFIVKTNHFDFHTLL